MLLALAGLATPLGPWHIFLSGHKTFRGLWFFRYEMGANNLWHVCTTGVCKSISSCYVVHHCTKYKNSSSHTQTQPGVTAPGITEGGGIWHALCAVTDLRLSGWESLIINEAAKHFSHSSQTELLSLRIDSKLWSESWIRSRSLDIHTHLYWSILPPGPAELQTRQMT